MKKLNAFIYVLSAIILLVFAGTGDAHPVLEMSKIIDVPSEYKYVTYKNGNHILWNNYPDYKIRTVNNNGDIEAIKALNLGVSTSASKIIPTSDGGFAAMAGDDLNSILIKYDANFNEQWRKTWKQGNGSHFIDLIQTGDGYVILDEIYIIGGYQMYIIHTDSSGNEKLFKKLNYSTYFSSVHKTRDGGYVVAGSNYSFLILKFDSSDNLQWKKTIRVAAEHYNIEPVSDGGYIISGFIEEPDDYPDLNPNGWIAKLDSKGNTKWRRTISGAQRSRIYSIMETRDGNYLVVGDILKRNELDGLIVKFSKKGSKKWSFSAGSNESDTFHTAVETSKNKYTLFGSEYNIDSGGMTQIYAWFAKVYDRK